MIRKEVTTGVVGSFSFNPSAPINPTSTTQIPGYYVWHCHITDHEDNEMMRPDTILPNTTINRTYVQGTDYYIPSY